MAVDSPVGSDIPRPDYGMLIHQFLRAAVIIVPAIQGQINLVPSIPRHFVSKVALVMIIVPSKEIIVRAQRHLARLQNPIPSTRTLQMIRRPGVAINKR